MKKFLCNPRLLLGLFLLCGIVLLAALLFFSLCLAVVLSGQGLAERPGRHGR